MMTNKENYAKPCTGKPLIERLTDEMCQYLIDAEGDDYFNWCAQEHGDSDLGISGDGLTINLSNTKHIYQTAIIYAYLNNWELTQKFRFV